MNTAARSRTRVARLAALGSLLIVAAFPGAAAAATADVAQAATGTDCSAGVVRVVVSGGGFETGESVFADVTVRHLDGVNWQQMGDNAPADMSGQVSMTLTSPGGLPFSGGESIEAQLFGMNTGQLATASGTVSCAAPPPAPTKNGCKGSGWQTWGFRNQGDCLKAARG
jgi:hypothetical protein